jgi:ParB-like chromosome segregation protein Spo0J
VPERSQPHEKLYWPIDTLHNWASNPREISVEKFGDLKDSLKAEGQLIPLLVDVRPDHEGEVLGGNMTLRALRDLGIQQVWVEPRTPRDDAHAFELAIKHNMAYGTYNAQQVAELGQQYIDQLDLTKLDIPGKAESVQDILDKISPPEDAPLEYHSQFQVVVECTNEIEQQEVYEKLQGLGLSCKVLTI